MMMNKTWWQQSVVYQIYPRSFQDSNGDGIGDLMGIVSRLDYLQTLGIDVIWLGPVYKSPMIDNGYDIADYLDIDPMFGTLDDMMTLIQEAEKKGIGIVMDLVVNHTSDQHQWFQESRASKDNPYRDYYVWRDQPTDKGSVFGGSAWTYDESTNQYYLHQFAKEQPDLNWENPKIIEEVCHIINWWLEKGIKGFRMDVIDLIGKEVDKGIFANGPRLHPLLQQLNRCSFGNYNVMTVGETWGATPEIAALYSDPNRHELSMIFQFEHMVIDWGQYGKWQPKLFQKTTLFDILYKWQTELTVGWNSLFWNNHDLPRIVSRWGNDTTYHYESATMLATILHLMKGTPYIYQGEEIGMTNVMFPSLEDYNDVEIHQSYQELVTEKGVLQHDTFMDGVYKMGRDNARTPFQWNSTKHAGFTTGTPWLQVNPNYQEINAKEDQGSSRSVYHHYQSLITLRRNSELSNIIVRGDFQVMVEPNETVVYYKRYLNNKELHVLANFSEEIVSNPYVTSNQDIILKNYPDVMSTLRPYETIVWVK
jgi:glycosidase